MKSFDKKEGQNILVSADVFPVNKELVNKDRNHANLTGKTI